MSILFSYDDLWRIYLAAVAILSLSGYLILKPLPWIWLRWALLIPITLVLVTALEVQDNGWQAPGLVYWMFEHFLVKSETSKELLESLIINFCVGLLVTTLFWLTYKLLKKDQKPSQSKSTETASSNQVVSETQSSGAEPSLSKPSELKANELNSTKLK